MACWALSVDVVDVVDEVDDVEEVEEVDDALPLEPSVLAVVEPPAPMDDRALAMAPNNPPPGPPGGGGGGAATLLPDPLVADVPLADWLFVSAASCWKNA